MKKIIAVTLLSLLTVFSLNSKADIEKPTPVPQDIIFAVNEDSSGKGVLKETDGQIYLSSGQSGMVKFRKQGSLRINHFMVTQAIGPAQEHIAIKDCQVSYQSDRLYNWIRVETMDGCKGGGFTISKVPHSGASDTLLVKFKGPFKE